MFKVPSAWRSVTVDGYVDPSGGNRVKIYFLIPIFMRNLRGKINFQIMFTLAFTEKCCMYKYIVNVNELLSLYIG